MAKKFKDLTYKDSIYYIDPVTHSIEGWKIKNVQGIDISKFPNISMVDQKRRQTLKTYLDIEVFQNTMAFQSKDIESMPTFHLILDGNLEAQLIMAKTQLPGQGEETIDLPTYVCTSTQELKNFMNGAS